ncbi:MAG: hypothetical protein AAGF12_18450 [Myxococcota bacterium]
MQGLLEIACTVGWPLSTASAQPYGEQGRRIEPRALDAALARLAREGPPLPWLLERAVGGRLLQDSADVDGAMSRTRASGLIPSVRASVRRGLGQDATASFSGDSDRTNLSTDDNLAFEGSLTFDLARLLYSREEVPLLRERRAIDNARHHRAREVIELYYERWRLMLARDLAGEGGLETEMRLRMLSSELDYLTDGGMREWARRRRRDR